MAQPVDFDTPAEGLDPFRAPAGDLDLAYDVFAGGSGPAVILLHELDGITPALEHLAQRVAGAGFTVYAPRLFGGTKGALLACIRKEFVCWSTGKTSPVIKWLDALAVEAQHRDPQHREVGAIGMCFTGGFSLAMVATDGPVKAAVVAQPSLPWGAPAALMPKRRELALGLSESDHLGLEQRLREQRARVLPLRFEEDVICPRARVEAIAALEGADPVHYVAGRGHPTLTAHFRTDEGHAGSAAAIDAAMTWLADVL